MKPVEIVRIEKLIPVFKNLEDGSVAANAIEVARICDNEGNSLEFNIIVGKGLYNVGDSVVYIMPDYALPPTPLFMDYYAPDGDMKKSKLGKRGRIRAVKFNFSFENEVDPIYSNGIILPLKLVEDYWKVKIEEAKEKGETYSFEDIQESLQVIKYVAEDSLEGGNHSGMTKGELPSFLYATDETRIESIKKHVNMIYEEREELGFTLKRDGSSITDYVRIDPETNEFMYGICSRNQEKKLDQTQTTGYKDPIDGIIMHKFYNKETETKCWKNDFSGKMYSLEEVVDFEPVEIDVRDAWIDTLNDLGYASKILVYCVENNAQLALRGELIGQGNKGSGNKLNWDARDKSRVVWFGVDDLTSGHATRIHYGQENNLIQVCEELEMEYTKELWSGIMDYDTIIKECNDYFKKIKEETGQIVEGIVIRSKYSNKLSCKYINPEYDAKS